MTSLRFAFALASLLAFSMFFAGCPKDEPANTTPVPTNTAVASASPTETGAAMSTPAPTPDAVGVISGGPAWTIGYAWSGGLSIYQHYNLAIAQTGETAIVTFKVKPLKTDEVIVNDTLSAGELAELKALFETVKFSEVTGKPRRIRIMDIGQTTITREIKGGAKHEVMENPGQEASSDIKPLRAWFDQRVRMYLEKSGVKPKKAAPSPTP